MCLGASASCFDAGIDDVDIASPFDAGGMKITEIWRGLCLAASTAELKIGTSLWLFLAG